jgi:hypothetical protein
VLKSLAATAIASLVLGLAPVSAQAATVAFDDPQGDSGGVKRLDVTGVRVASNDDRVVVRVAFANDRPGDLIVSIDPRGALGLRLVAEKSASEDGDDAISQQIVRGAFTDKTFRGGAVTCGGYRVRWSDTVARIVMPSRCLHDGDYGAIRVAVLTENGSDSDYAPETKDATGWIARG